MSELKHCSHFTDEENEGLRNSDLPNSQSVGAEASKEALSIVLCLKAAHWASR